jgi:hypothetical protein
MQKTIIIDDIEYICSDKTATFSDDEVIFEIMDIKGRMSYVIAGPTDLLGDSIKNIWFIETTNKLEPQSIFPTDMFYDDEYYKSTYFPTIEEEAELSKLSSDKNEHNN